MQLKNTLVLEGIQLCKYGFFFFFFMYSVLGAAIIWGKSQEQAKEECEVYDDSKSYSPVVPLLKNKRMEE